MKGLRSRRIAESHSLPLLFTVGAASVYLAALSLAPRLDRVHHPTVVALGLTLDLVLVVPAAFYFMVVRRRGWPVVAVAPAAVLGLLAAGELIPLAHQGPVRLFEMLAIPAEVSVLAWIGWRASRALNAARADASADPLERLRRAGVDLLRREIPAGILSSELGALYYLLGSWRARPHAPAGSRAVTYHRCGAQGAMVGALVLILFAEGAAMHLLVSLWSPMAAWLLSFGTLYTIGWLIADFRARRLRPILVEDGAIELKAGLRWSLTVPREAILSVAARRPGDARDSLNLAFLQTPTIWLTFDRPVRARGLYGITRAVRSVGIAPDSADRSAFDRAGPGPFAV